MSNLHMSEQSVGRENKVMKPVEEEHDSTKDRMIINSLCWSI